MARQPCPIPFATITNREAGHMGHNYFKSLFAVGFQGMLYHGLHGGLRRAGAGYRGGQRPDGGHLDLRGYTVLLCFVLFKTGSLSKSIWGAH